MKKFYTAESVTEGHPDKVCDQIADTILDACLKGDLNSHVACEVLATKGTVLLAGEISSSCEPDVLELAEGVVERIGYDPKDFLFDSLIHRQSPDIAEGVRVSREKRQNPAAEADWSMGAGDQGIMTGYACRENPQMLPMPVLLANRIVRELDAARKSEYWKSRDIGGKYALKFLQVVDGIPFPDAMRILQGEFPNYVPIKPVEEEKKAVPFVLPKQASDNSRIWRYLRERGSAGKCLATALILEFCMRVFRITTLFLLEQMKMVFQSMHFSVEFMNGKERLLNWSRVVVIKRTAFVFRLLECVAGWQSMKQQLRLWHT